MENCFKLHRYPDWYKGDETKGAPRLATQVIQDQSGTEIASNTPLDFGDYEKSESKLDALLNVVCQEVIKALKSKGVGSSALHVLLNLMQQSILLVSFICPKNYLTILVSNLQLVDGWIIDSAASDGLTIFPLTLNCLSILERCLSLS